MKNPSNDPVAPHELNFNYWYTSLCRLAFVVVFEVNCYNDILGFLFQITLLWAAFGIYIDGIGSLHNPRYSTISEG